jgi:hypothetical protein
MKIKGNRNKWQKESSDVAGYFAFESKGLKGIQIYDPDFKALHQPAYLNIDQV